MAHPFRGYTSRLADDREGIHLCAAEEGSDDHAGCYQLAFADAVGTTDNERAADLQQRANDAVDDVVTVTSIAGVSGDYRVTVAWT